MFALIDVRFQMYKVVLLDFFYTSLCVFADPFVYCINMYEWIVNREKKPRHALKYLF